MTDTRNHRQQWVEDEVGRLGELVALAMPTVLGVVALFLPMFEYVDPEVASGDVLAPTGSTEQATLVGLVFDPGLTGPTTAIRITALLVVAGLLTSAAMVAPWVRERSGVPGATMLIASGVALLAALVLWLMTQQHDDQGRFGTEGVDPMFPLLLAMVVPVWFLLARGRSTRW